jgi:hypothetical protein
VRIPLDYYRILGVPCQATDEQIHQAHDDRGRQLPRQEYSEQAIAARKHLLDEAYQILADRNNRRAYNARFLERESIATEVHALETPDIPESSPSSFLPSIEVENPYFVGALLFLQDLGEYELVTRLGEEYLDESAFAPTRPDIALTIALAWWELSGERWREQEYEKAAELAERAIHVLETDRLFSGVVREVRHDFYRLRPYRILELLSLDLGRIPERSRGLVLLEEILDDRCGIDGKGDDRSGLSVDDFLRFIQQLRSHLTLDEQKQLFDREARRPSAVGAYLQVYIYLAKGFARKQPEAIVQASDRLERLQKHQDVYLEQAICALLLGQVEEITTILEKSQDKNTLRYIREQSPDPDDLLPGLCHYGERWLQSEVLSHFRDLKDRPLSLKEYFADEIVQNSLEKLSEFPNKKTSSEIVALSPNPLESEVTIISAQREPARSTVSGLSAMSESAYSYSQPRKPSRSGRGRSSRYTAPVREENPAAASAQSGGLLVTAAYRQPSVTENPPRRSRPDRVREAAPRTRKTRRGKLRLDRVAILAAGVLGTVGILGFGVKALVDSQSPLAALSGEQLSIELNTPVIEMPSLEARASEPAAITPETAQETVRIWLTAKGEALGPNHQTGKLTEILTGPALALWQQRAEALKGTHYWKYDHQIEVRSAKINPQDQNLATVEARVKEKATYYANGKEAPSRSYDDTLDIRYDLVRSGDRWMIQNTKVIK